MRLSTLLKFLFTIAGLVYILLTIPLDAIWFAITHAQGTWLLVAFLLILGSLVVRAFRWWLLLKGLGANVGLGRLIALYFVGAFFNTFLPSGFGGDAVRVIEATQDAPMDVAAGTVILDRLTGLLMLFVMALLALPFRPSSFPDGLAVSIAALSLAGLVGGFLLLGGGLIYRLGRWAPASLSPVGSGPVARLMQAIRGCGRGAIGQALFVSLVFNLMLVAWWLAAGLAVGLQIPLVYYLLVVPILSVGLLAPSVGGLGVRESLAPLLFATAGAAEARAVAMSLLVFALTVAAGLLGAPLYVVSLWRK
ncbi:MAG: lysylphosphatidylglycerol synthase transmembrane domain-containing protein [Chloroflexota bacterium]